MDDEIKDATKGWLKAIRPPRANATDRHVQAWRWAIAITTGVTTLSLAIHIALVCGFLSFMHPGFARASDVDQIRIEQKIERQNDLEQKLLEVREKQCTATGQVRSLHTMNLQKMLIEYNRLSGSNYPLPDCRDFVTQ